MFNVNKIIILLCFVFISISIFFLFKDINAEESLKGYYIVYFYFFLVLSILSIIIIISSNVIKIYFFLFFCSLVGSLYLFEFYIYKKGNIKFFKRDLDSWENKLFFLQKKVIEENAFTAFSYESSEIHSLSGLQNSKVLMCNESGFWAKYNSDMHGFNNPNSVWLDKNLDVVLLGDSFTKGECVNQGDEIASQLRKLQNFNVINLGWQATGPLRQFATYKEFINNKKTKYIFWIYFEDNDLDDLLNERKNEILMNYYIDDNFTQNLTNKEVKLKVNKLILSRHNEFMNENYEINTNIKTYSNFVNYLKLYKTRKIILGNIYKLFHEDNDNLNTENYDDKNLDFYLSLFDKLKKFDNNETKIVLVYLPREKFSFTGGFKRSKKIKDTIISELKKKNIGIIDIDKEIRENFFNPGDLYPKQHVGMHFNEKGYRFIAEKINEFINQDIKN